VPRVRSTRGLRPQRSALSARGASRRCPGFHPAASSSSSQQTASACWRV